jgi:hypothetical protein
MRRRNFLALSSGTAGGVPLEHLPDNLFGQRVTLHPAAAIDWAEDVAVHHAGATGPGIDCDLDPGGHGHGSHAPVLSN